MKRLVFFIAMLVGISINAQAVELSDYLDSQYEIQWATETEFKEFSGGRIIDPLAAYDTEGTGFSAGSGDVIDGPVVDVAVMEIVGNPQSNEDVYLFVNTYE